MKILTALLVLASAGIAQAQPAKITMDQVSSLYQSLASNFGTESKFKLESVPSFSIALDMTRLKAILDAYNSVLRDKAAQIAKANPGDVAPAGSQAIFKAGTPSERELASAMAPLWAKQQDIDLDHIKLDDLNIGTDASKSNAIPPAVLSALLPIIDR